MDPTNTDLHTAFHTPWRYRRLVVRDDESSPWRWFDAPVAFTFAHTGTAYGVLENQCAEAVFRYPTHCIRIIEADRLEAFDRLDLSSLP